MSALATRVGNAYNQALNKHPILTNSATGFVLACLGDIVTQKYLAEEEKKRRLLQTIIKTSSSSSKGVVQLYKHDHKGITKNEETSWWQPGRTLEMGVIRAAVVAPFVYFWYPFLVRMIPGRGMHRVLGRVCFDQAFGSPMVVCMVFIASAILQGTGPIAAWQRIRDKGIVTWMAGLKFWPFVHTINFGFVPSRHQPLFAHICSLYWNAVLSYYANIKME